MAEPQPLPAADAARVQAELHEVAESLRQGTHVDPAVQRQLADLLDAISRSMAAGAPVSPALLHVGRSATELAQRLHQQQERGPLAAAKEQLQRTLARVEVESPQVAALAQRIIDALVNIGI